MGSLEEEKSSQLLPPPFSPAAPRQSFLMFQQLVPWEVLGLWSKQQPLIQMLALLIYSWGPSGLSGP